MNRNRNTQLLIKRLMKGGWTRMTTHWGIVWTQHPTPNTRCDNCKGCKALRCHHASVAEACVGKTTAGCSLPEPVYPLVQRGASEIGQVMDTPKRVVLTGVSSDSHTWNLVFVQLLLEHLGHEVVNLGACTPDNEVVAACRTHAPDLLVVSTVNGHGNIDGERLIGEVRSNLDLRNLPAVIGGQLGIKGAEGHEALIGRLLAAGFSAVFEASGLPTFLEFVKRVSFRTPVAQLMEVGR